jgi:hypothetical protein
LTINIKPYNYRFSYKLGDSKFKMENLYGFWGNKNYKFSIFINAGNEIHLDNDEVIKALSSSKDRNGVVSLFTGMKRTLNDT